MSDLSSDDLQPWLDRLRQGDDKARSKLVEFACERFVLLTRRMLNDFCKLRSFEQTGDVMQSAMLRLWWALKDVHPATVREFHGLVAVEIRRSLLDLSRKYFGRSKTGGVDHRRERELPEKSPAHHHGQMGEETESTLAQPSAHVDGAARFASLMELYDQVEALPDDERELVNLLYYLDLPQHQVAEVLEVDQSTVKRRWQKVRLKLAHLAKDWGPAE